MQLSDAGGDHTFDIGHITPHDDGYRVGIRSAYDSRVHTFVLHKGDWGEFTAIHGADPPVDVVVDQGGAPGDPRRCRAFFAAADGEDVAGHAADNAAVFAGIVDGEHRSGGLDSATASAVAQGASCAYVLIWQLAAAADPTRQLVTLARGCAACA